MKAITKQIEDMTLVEMGQALRRELVRADDDVCGAMVAVISALMVRKFGKIEAAKVGLRLGILRVGCDARLATMDGRWPKLDTRQSRPLRA
jgi:hypothetical protein